MNKRKVALTIISILIAVCVLLSFSYAIYIISPSNTHNIAVTANIPSCAGITLNNDTKITLTGDKAAPISDSKALSSENYRYSFTVSNGCSTSATMKVALALGSASTMPEGTIKYAIYESTGSIPSSGTFLNTNTKVLTNQIISEVADVTNDTLSIGYEILSTTLATNTSKTYYVYIWIDENEGGLGNNTTIDKSFIGHLIVSDYETLGDNAIAFSINGTSYHGYESMTWQQWVNSSFNTDGYKIKNNQVYSSDESYYINVTSSTTVVNNNAYTLQESIILLSDKIVVGTSGTGSVVNEGNGLRYEGQDPNNYVCFSSTCTNDTLYRIIGKFTEFVDTDNDGVADTNQSVIKLIKNTSIGNMPWDYYSSPYAYVESQSDKRLINNRINNSKIKLLNNYFNNEIAAADPSAEGDSNWTTASLKNYLNNNWTKPTNNILTTRWYLKIPNSGGTASDWVSGERNGVKYSSNPDYADYKVGLMYPSDYGYASLALSCSRSTSLYNYNTSGCYNQNWIYINAYQWTISPLNGGSWALCLTSSGELTNTTYNTWNSIAVKPSFYISSETQLYYGDGTSISPYRLSVPTTSSMTIGGTTYSIYQGMNWEDWIKSSFNTDGYKIMNNKIYKSDETQCIDVTPSTEITTGGSYSLTTPAISEITNINYFLETGIYFAASDIILNNGTISKFYVSIDNTSSYVERSNWYAACLGDDQNHDLYVYAITTDGNTTPIYLLSDIYMASCFTGDTKVKSSKGYTNIENIKVGDKVYSYNEITKTKELKEVTKTLIHEDNRIYEIRVGNKIIKVTPDHRMYVKAKYGYAYNWTNVINIHEGDYLLDSNNQEVRIDSIKYYESKNNIKVYNIEVKDNHTYYVSDGDYLVHNAKSPCSTDISGN